MAAVGGGGGGTVDTDNITVQGNGSSADKVRLKAVQHDGSLAGSGIIGDLLRVVQTIGLPVVVADAGSFTAVAAKTNLIPPFQAGPIAVTFPLAASVPNGGMLAIAMFNTSTIVVDAVPGAGDHINGTGDGVPLNSTTLETLWVSDGASNWWQIANYIAPAAPTLFPATSLIGTATFTPTVFVYNRIDPALLSADDVTVNLPEASTVANGTWVGISIYPLTGNNHNLIIHPFAGDTVEAAGADLSFNFFPSTITLLFASDGVSDWFLISQFLFQSS